MTDELKVLRVRTGRDVARVLRAFERRWEEGHRAGVIHPFEASRILAGDFAPIIRELEPAFTEGQKCVLSRTRPRGALVRDPVLGVEILYPKPPPEDLFWIVIRNVVRHKAGHWRVRFDVWDRRETSPLVRRKPPAYVHGEEEGPRPDDAQVTFDSAYTTNPRQALDHLQAVPSTYQNVLVMQAKERFSTHRQEAQADEEAERDLRRVRSELSELVKRATKMGVDPLLVLAPIAREIQTQHADLKDAA